MRRSHSKNLPLSKAETSPMSGRTAPPSSAIDRSGLARYEEKKKRLAAEVASLRDGPKITAQLLREAARSLGYV